MIRSVFPRLFSFFREAALVRGVFNFEDTGDIWSVRADPTSHPELSVADGGTGLVVVTFPKCREVEVIHASVRNTAPGTFGNIMQVELPVMTAAIAQAGTFTLALYKEDGTSGVPGLLDPVDDAALVLALWIGR